FEKVDTNIFAVALRIYRLDEEIVGKMRRAGVEFLAGTDVCNPFCFPGFSLHEELARLVKAGLTPMEALQAATINPARYLGKERELGSIQPGKLADLVLLDADPIEDIHNSARIRAVFANGRVYDRTALDKFLQKAEAAVKQPVRPVNSSKYIVEPLDAAKHRRNDFSCEAPELTEFLRKRALKEMESRASACFVLVPDDDMGRIAGYYTLSAATVSLAKLHADLAKRLPRYPDLPATLLGRLARDQAFRGSGLGGILLTSALRRALENTVVIGSVAVVTDPIDERAAVFYRRYGFRAYDETGRRLVMGMVEISACLSQGGIT
ncbi:MAG TPA: GNAT family N-acetyltransferase, partial [Verrucomicrobiae bacterium]|nr:GNAT family N-acetyltransferase [Verrucomicrobiae bacterium]